MISEDMKDEVYEFLSDLRDTGVTNMLGSPPYLEAEFGFSRKEAAEWFKAWAASLSDD